jgi:hypothetical protein
MVKWIICAVPNDSERIDVESLVDEISTPFGFADEVLDVTFYSSDPSSFMHILKLMKRRKTELVIQQYEMVADIFESSALPDKIGTVIFTNLMKNIPDERLHTLSTLINNTLGQANKESVVYNDIEKSSNIPNKDLIKDLKSQNIEICLVKAKFKKKRG